MSDMDKLQGLLNTVAYPESPEERDAAEDAIKDLLGQAWEDGVAQCADAIWDHTALPVNPYRQGQQ